MRSATGEGLADGDGYPTPRLFEEITKLAKGGVGLIVPGFVYPMKQGQVVPAQTGMQSEKHVMMWKDTIKKVHSYPSKIIFQVCHGGFKCKKSITGYDTVAPSSLKDDIKEISVTQIEEVIEAFIRTAARLKAAGADGIQLHCAHGYLLSEFLCPALNRRTDKWGGSSENRLRIVFEIAQAIREQQGSDFMISMKMNGDDYVDGGVNAVLAGWYVSKLPMVDLFEISCGITNKPYATRVDFDKELVMNTLETPDAKEICTSLQEATSDIQYYEGYNVELTETIHRIAPNAHLAVVGGLRSISVMDEVLNAGNVELISIARPFIRQPNLVNLFKSGKITKADCVSCGLCCNDGDLSCLYPKK